MAFQLELILRMVVAALCGLVVGLERRHHHKQAGLGTFMIVAVASALLMEVSKYGFSDVEKVDSARIAAQVVSGISFLGAGIIMKRNQNIEGLTTAAGIWAMAAIGLAIGAGMYLMGIVSTVLYMIISYVTRFIKQHQNTYFESYKVCTTDMDSVIQLHDTSSGNKVLNYSMDKKDTYISIEIAMRFNSKKEKAKWEEEILHDSHTISFEFEG